MRDEQIADSSAAPSRNRVITSPTLWRGISILAVLCIAAAFRLYRIQDESPWFDEVMSMYPLNASSYADFLKVLHSDNPAVLPFYFVVEYVLTRMTGTSEIALRLLSVFISLLTVATLYAFGRRLFGHTAGLVAAACLALSQRHIYYDQEIRMYALTYLFALLSLATLSEALRRGQLRWWLLHITCNGLLVWTHLLGGALLVAEGIFLLVAYPNYWKRSIVWGLAQLPFVLPIGWWLQSDDFGQVEYVTSWIPPATWQSLFYHYFVVLAGQSADARIVYSLGIPISSQYLTATLLLALAIWALVWTFRKRVSLRAQRTSESEWHFMWSLDNRLPFPQRNYGGYNGRTFQLLLLAFAVPPFVVFILSLTVEQCFVGRYFLYSSMPIFLLAGAGVGAISQPLLRSLIGTVLIAAFALQASALVRPFRPDLSSAVKVYNAIGKNGDLVFVTKNDDPQTLDFGYGMPRSYVKYSPRAFDDALALAALGRDVWIFFRSEAPYWPIDLESKLEHESYYVDRFFFSGSDTLAVYRITPYAD